MGDSEILTEDSSAPESVDVSEGEGVTRNTDTQEEEKLDREFTEAEEKSNHEHGAKPTESEDFSVENSTKNMDNNQNEDVMLTPEKLKSLVHDDETRDVNEVLHGQEASPQASVNEGNTAADADEPKQGANTSEQENPSLMANGDHRERSSQEISAPDMSSLNKSLPRDDDGEVAAPSFEEQGKLDKEAEDKQGVMELAEKLSQLRSIGNSAESTAKGLSDDTILVPPDTGMEDLVESDDHMADLLAPKRLDFEAIDFDQFGAQPPDLPLSDGLDEDAVGNKENLHGGDRNPEKETGEGTGEKLDERNGHPDVGSEVEQETTKSYDGSLNTELDQQLQGEGYGVDPYHIAPNRIEELQAEDELSSSSSANTEGEQGHSIFRDPESQQAAEIDGNSKPFTSENVGVSITSADASQHIESNLKSNLRQPPKGDDNEIRSIPEKQGLPLAHRPTRRSKRKTEVKGSTAEETQKLMKELKEICQNQEKQLGDLNKQIDVLTAQLNEQAKIHEELELKFEAECDERLKSEAKLIVLHEMLPNQEEKLKDLCDQVLSVAAQLQEQVELRKALEDKLDHEHKERMQDMGKLAEQSKLLEELERKLEEELDKRLRSEANLMERRNVLSDEKDTLKDLRDHVASLAAQLQEQEESRKDLEEKLDQECKARMQNVVKLKEQTQLHEDLERRLDEERLRSETDVMVLREMLPNEDKLKDLEDQVVCMAAQLQEQIQLRKELEDMLNQERKESMQSAVKASDDTSESLPVSSMPWSQEKLEFTKLLDEQKLLLANQVKEAEKLQNAAEQKVGMLHHQVQNLEALSDIAETMEYVFSAKERATRQALWTMFQSLCFGLGLLYFLMSCRDSLRNSLQPT